MEIADVIYETTKNQGGVAMKLTGKKQSKKQTNKKQDVLTLIRKMKDSNLEIDLKDLEWQQTSNPETYYYGTRLEMEGVRIRVQLFVKAI